MQNVEIQPSTRGRLMALTFAIAGALLISLVSELHWAGLVSALMLLLSLGVSAARTHGLGLPVKLNIVAGTWQLNDMPVAQVRVGMVSPLLVAARLYPDNSNKPQNLLVFSDSLPKHQHRQLRILCRYDIPRSSQQA